MNDGAESSSSAHDLVMQTSGESAFVKSASIKLLSFRSKTKTNPMKESNAFNKFKAKGEGRQMINNKVAIDKHQQVKQIFQTEYEYFLHHMWSQKGYKNENNADEYRNLANLNSGNSMRSNPMSS